MAAVDMSIDNMIQNNRHHGVRSEGRGKGLRGVRGPRGTFRGDGRLAGHPYRGHLGTHAVGKTMHKTRNLAWQNCVLEDRFKAVESSGVESGTKLQVSNLNDGVSNEDIRKLFSEIGELVRYAIHYDKDGRPCGSAEVVFARRNDAFQAVKRYNNAQLDGNPMKIENVGSVARAHVTSRLTVVGGANGRRTVLKTPGTGYTRNRPGPGYMRNRPGPGYMSNRPGPGYMRNRPGPGYMRNAAILNHGVGPSSLRPRGGWNANVPVRGRGGRFRGRGHHGRGGRPVVKSAEELDKELENYQAENTQA
ncbi:RNA metabolism protein [Lithospermum erythrorhizon]|uniref:RNA metabolism protein n=1 Tax=Lithospermum erythrorhizon TaxID=34254 RepID=A0AAV3PHZ2_LITER